MNSSERTGLLLFRYTRKELSAAEENELAAWRASSSANESFFRSVTDPGYLQGQVRKIYETKDKVYSKLLGEFPGYFTEAPVKTYSRVSRVLAVAACLVALLGFGIYSLLRTNVVQPENLQPGINKVGIVDENGVAQILDDFHRGYLTGWAGISVKENDHGDAVYYASSRDQAAHNLYYWLYTSPNGQLDLRLPDGSRVLLNGNSSVRYPRNFSQDSIMIFIEGEAFVELAKSDKHVEVILNNSRIEAPGTKMNVQAYPGDSFTRITLLSGSAHVFPSPHDSRQDSVTELNPGKEARIFGDKVEISDGDIRETFAWKNGRIYFKDASIESIMRSIEHSYGVKVIYKGTIPNQKFSLDKPRKTRLLMLLISLETQGLHYTIEKNAIIVN